VRFEFVDLRPACPGARFARVSTKGHAGCSKAGIEDTDTGGGATAGKQRKKDPPSKPEGGAPELSLAQTPGHPPSYVPSRVEVWEDAAWKFGGGRVNKGWKRHIRMFLNLWPPFLGAGIRVKRWTANWREIDVEMKLRRWNTNYVGTHYGGSLYSMTDPFFMVMLIENLGTDYVVWDKSASIRFRKPGRGTVFANFRLSDEQIKEIREALQSQEKIERVFTVEVRDESGTVIAEVQKLLHVRKRGDSGR
jgi:hypothetical protein